MSGTETQEDRSYRRCPDGDWPGDTEPGGMECETCGCIFISNEGRALCKVCQDRLDKRAAEIMSEWKVGRLGKL